MKENKFWKKHKATKEEKDWYRKEAGLEAEDIYLPTPSYFKMMNRLVDSVQKSKK